MHPTLLLLLGAASALAFPHPEYNLPPPSRSNIKSILTVSTLTSKATAIAKPIAGSCGKNGIATVTVTKIETAGASRPSVAYSGPKLSFGSGGNTASNSGSQSSYESGGYAAGISEHIEHTGPVETLRPVVHWNVDTKPAKNIIPVATGNGCPQYYAQGANTGSWSASVFIVYC